MADAAPADCLAKSIRGNAMVERTPIMAQTKRMSIRAKPSALRMFTCQLLSVL